MPGLWLTAGGLLREDFDELEAVLRRGIASPEHAAFVGNCIALTADTVWMSAAADAALSPAHRTRLSAAGFGVRSVPLAAIEAAGGSLRCCIGEIY